jgi:hypothetical protein
MLTPILCLLSDSMIFESQESSNQRSTTAPHDEMEEQEKQKLSEADIEATLDYSRYTQLHRRDDKLSTVSSHEN